LSGRAPMIMSRKSKLVALTVVFSAGITFLVGEIFLRVLSPQETMYPRPEFSPHYGFQRHRGTPVVHEAPGRWRFQYNINEYRYRGEAVPISNEYPTQNVVVLGDSYSLGFGVQDGEEYPAVMKRALGSDFEVINLGIGGWGLTQQIRRFYEFGQAYQPALVVLQFTSNDPQDNLTNRVTAVEDGRFVFNDSLAGVNRFKKYLSASLIQKSQLYNLFRDSAYRLFASRTIADATHDLEGRNTGEDRSVPVEERFHAELLEAFATDLTRRGTPLLLIAVNRDLGQFPFIWEEVQRLEAEDKLAYCEVSDWLEGESDYDTPEGHLWGAKAHKLIGTGLASVVGDALLDEHPVRTVSAADAGEVQLP
jgi:hypothetical protein